MLRLCTRSSPGCRFVEFAGRPRWVRGLVKEERRLAWSETEAQGESRE